MWLHPVRDGTSVQHTHTELTHPTSAIHPPKRAIENISYKMMMMVVVVVLVAAAAAVVVVAVVMMRPAGRETRSGSYHPSTSLLPSFIIWRASAVSKEKHKNSSEEV